MQLGTSQWLSVAFESGDFGLLSGHTSQIQFTLPSGVFCYVLAFALFAVAMCDAPSSDCEVRVHFGDETKEAALPQLSIGQFSRTIDGSELCVHFGGVFSHRRCWT